MSIEILKTLDPKIVKEFMKIHFQMMKTTEPEKFIKDFSEYTTYLKNRNKNENITLSKFSFKQFLLSKIIKAPLT